MQVSTSRRVAFFFARSPRQRRIRLKSHSPRRRIDYAMSKDSDVRTLGTDGNIHRYRWWSHLEIWGCLIAIMLLGNWRSPLEKFLFLAYACAIGMVMALLGLSIRKRSSVTLYEDHVVIA